jgi:glycosyltransferase involved in cell wall biosynthesis
LLKQPVTVIIATYNRPDTLAAAIRSVRGQTFSDWKLLVVGDNCDDTTEKTVRSFADGRISYVNLPVRFGQQAGPNSVGMALADTPFVALLNHDDIWLPDHLEKAFDALDVQKWDVYVGRAATARLSIDKGSAGRIPLFDRTNPQRRFRQDLYSRHWVFFEPVSTFIFETALVRRMGNWPSGAELYRSPLQEWLLRAWRLKARFRFGKEITVLNLVTHYQYRSGKGVYSGVSLEHRHVEAMMEGRSSDQVRDLVSRDMKKGGKIRKGGRMFRTSNPLSRIVYDLVANPLTAWLFFLTGWDAYAKVIPLAGMEKGVTFVDRSMIRTGKAAPEFEDFDRTLRMTITGIQCSKGKTGD